MSKNTVDFYKAYILWKQALENNKEYKNYIKSLNNQTSGDVELLGVVGNKIIDLEWVKKIEDSLPFMDKAIRESRSFIEQRDEIVPIEKVKRVNTQSIRHLAQHTNLIAKVEKNGDVLPDRILNIYYESSFGIYENRFLITLLEKLVDFVENRYQALKNKDEKIDVNYNVNKLVRRKQRLSKMELKFSYKTNASVKFGLKDDTSSLSGFTRVLRIRSIIHDFYAAPLIKDLISIDRVRPPIIHTNLMTKNVDFRNCLELWDYIDMYKGTGFIYEDKHFTGKIPKHINNRLQDIFIFINFLTEITFNTEKRNLLNKEYLKQERIEKRNKAKKEKELLSSFEENLNKKHVNTLQKNQEKLLNRHNKQVEKLQAQKQRQGQKIISLQEKLKIEKAKLKEERQKLKTQQEQLKNVLNKTEKIQQVKALPKGKIIRSNKFAKSRNNDYEI